MKLRLTHRVPSVRSHDTRDSGGCRPARLAVNSRGELSEHPVHPADVAAAAFGDQAHGLRREGNSAHCREMANDLVQFTLGNAPHPNRCAGRAGVENL